MNGPRYSDGSGFYSGFSPISVAQQKPRHGWRLPFLLSLLGFATPAFAQVALSPATLAFGNEAIGVTTGSMTATLKNALLTPVTIDSITTSGFLGIFGGVDDFAVSGGNCPKSPATLAPGHTCSITVTFTPTVSGNLSGTLNVTTSPGGSPKGVELTGTGTGAITLSASSLTFASQSLGTTSAAQTVTLTNQSSASVNVSPVTISGDFAIHSNTCTSVAAGHMCTVGVTFTPTATGTRTGTLTINDTGAGSPELVSLTGTGAAAGGLASITVTPANPSVAEGVTQQFTATGNYINPTHTVNLTDSVTWASGKTSVATISNTSGSQGLASTVGLGIAGISATLGGIVGSTNLTVTAPTLVSIAVTPANASIALTAKQQFTATGTYTNSSTQNLTDTVTWASSVMGVATISNTSPTQGLATLGSITGSTTLTVVAGSLFSGSLNTARYFHTATLLNSGMVLVVGGVLQSPPPPCTVVDDVIVCLPATSEVLASAEVYDPGTGDFAYTNSLNTARYCHTATLLPNGQVLIAGGASVPGGGDVESNYLSTAELYNPATGDFTYTTNPMNAARMCPTATLLSNGDVLIAGGYNYDNAELASADIYNPATQTFTPATGSLNTARYYATATLLNNGDVLLAGGDNFMSGILSSAELSNSTGETFTYTATGASTTSCGTTLSTQSCMNAARYFDTATLLNNGSVLIAGGADSGGILGSAELYSPSAQTFTLTTGALNTVRAEHTATLLNNGTVLMAGGYNSVSGALTSEELYNPGTETFTNTGSLNNGRFLHTATLLNNGQVLLAGGESTADASLQSAELYAPASLTLPNLLSIAVSPSSPSVSLSTNPTLQFIATGTFSGLIVEPLATVTWSSSNSSIMQISNDQTSRGWAVAVGTGSVTITATDGTVSRAVTFTVNP